MVCLPWVTGPADDIKAIARQAQVERFHQRAGGELVCHEHITEDPDSLPCDHGLDGMQLLAKAEMLHGLEFGRAAPSVWAAASQLCQVGGSRSAGDQ